MGDLAERVFGDTVGTVAVVTAVIVATWFLSMIVRGKW